MFYNENKKGENKMKITKKMVEEYIVVKEEIEEKKMRLLELELDFIDTIPKDKFVTVNGYKVVHKINKGKKCPKWKEIVGDKLGKAFIEKTIKNTIPGKDSSKIVIEPYIKP